MQTRSAKKLLELDQTEKPWKKLVERVNFIFNFKGDASGCDSARLLLHLGLSVDTDYIERIFSTVQFANLMYTSLPNCNFNPLYSPICVLLEPNVSGIRSAAPRKGLMEKKFDHLKLLLYELERIDIGASSTSWGGLGFGRAIFKSIADIIERSEPGVFCNCKTPATIMAYLATNFGNFQHLFAGATSAQLTPAYVKESISDGKAIQSCCDPDKKRFWKKKGINK